MENNILEFKYNMLLNAIFSQNRLGYSGKSLRFENDEEISTILKALEPERFNETLERLLAEKEAAV